MVKVNWNRVVLGGFIWVVVFNVLWLSSWHLFLRSEWISAMAALGRTFPETLGGLALWLALMFFAGTFAIWLYAVLSRALAGTAPRNGILVTYGPGARTAAGVGVLLWLFIGLGPMLWNAHIFGLPTQTVTSTLAVDFVAVVVATIVGAWPYKEE
jgi:hypothetical protein